MKKNVILSAFLGVLTNNALAIDSTGAGLKLPENLSFSFFGTAGYAISDKPYPYYYGTISEHGSFNADSRIGAQMDWQISPRFSFILQGELAPVRDKEHRWRPRLSWAQLAYHVNDNWTLKIGRTRLPALLYTQNSNVGMSYFSARLPVEVYNLSPTFEYNGVSSTYVWDIGEDGMKTISWDVYTGASNFAQRLWMRDSFMQVQRGPNFFSRKLVAGGTFISYEDLAENNILRAGVHYAQVKDRNGSTFLKSYNVIRLPNGAEVYPLASTNTSDDVKYILLALMGNWHIGNGFYFTGEFGIRRAANVNSGSDSRAAHLNLRRRVGNFTPYVTWSYSISDSQSRRTYKNLSKPTGFAQYDLINRISGDALLITDQQTLALGTAYDIDSHQRLKLEYARMRIGRGDYLIDRHRFDGDLNGEGINIFSASYNFLF